MHTQPQALLPTNTHAQPSTRLSAQLAPPVKISKVRASEYGLVLRKAPKKQDGTPDGRSKVARQVKKNVQSGQPSLDRFFAPQGSKGPGPGPGSSGGLTLK
ncbi:hypothetical protein [Chitinolyticbacter albus]|uniref:hypothetical protein n=1 Tax=Chitinolyticbacter albus TaxID=2961951 RepID=UPI00210B11E6|nr:hypothetical protein [Chitinolyticbacter albus]